MVSLSLQNSRTKRLITFSPAEAGVASFAGQTPLSMTPAQTLVLQGLLGRPNGITAAQLTQQVERRQRRRPIADALGPITTANVVTVARGLKRRFYYMFGQHTITEARGNSKHGTGARVFRFGDQFPGPELANASDSRRSSDSPQWVGRSACIGAAREVFLPDEPSQATVRQALAYCATCPVIAGCLRDNMAAEDPEQRMGVFGGLTPAIETSAGLPAARQYLQAQWQQMQQDTIGLRAAPQPDAG
jgi:hypothetical protein